MHSSDTASCYFFQAVIWLVTASTLVTSASLPTSSSKLGSLKTYGVGDIYHKRLLSYQRSIPCGSVKSIIRRLLPGNIVLVVLKLPNLRQVNNYTSRINNKNTNLFHNILLDCNFIILIIFHFLIPKLTLLSLDSVQLSTQISCIAVSQISSNLKNLT